MANRTLAFLGLGKKKTTEQTAEAAAALDAEARRIAKGGEGAVEATTSDDDEEDEDEEDDEEDDEGSEDDRKAVRTRNALRAAGHRRGIAAERGRIAAAFNALDPGKVEMALHLALNTDLSADQLRAAIDKSPSAAAGKRTPFAAAMAAATPAAQPAFGADGRGAKPTLTGNMAALLKDRGLVPK